MFTIDAHNLESRNNHATVKLNYKCMSWALIFLIIYPKEITCTANSENS